MSNEGHRPVGRILHWPYCVRCGLIYLKNARTRRLIRKPCDADND